jgi:hypothetical protein
MNDLIVTGVTNGDDGERGQLETVSLSCKGRSRIQTAKGRWSLDAGVHFKYDINANKEAWSERRRPAAARGRVSNRCMEQLPARENHAFTTTLCTR